MVRQRTRSLGQSSTKNVQHRRRRLVLEALEDRRLLALSPGNLVAGSGLGTLGEIRVFDSSGEEQSRLAVPSQDRRGVPVAVADVNRDGVPDIVSGSGFGRPDDVRVFSGVDNAELLHLTPYGEKSRDGVFVAAADVNGDGAADVITSPARGKDPTVKVFSGIDGAELYQFDAHQRPVSRGEVNVAAGDLDGDGQVEIIAGVRVAGRSWVKLYQGSDGSPITEFEVSRRRGFDGEMNVTTADLNGDGSAEIIVGAGRGNRSTLQVFAADGVMLHELSSDFGGPRGGSHLAAADVNQDGHDDIITGSGLGMPSLVEVFSGADFSKLSSFQPFGKHDLGGVFVAGVPSTSQSLSLAANLANDTGPNGPNDDSVTSDAGLTVSISSPSSSPANPTTLYIGFDDATPDQPAGETQSSQATILLDHATLQSLHGGPLSDGPHVIYLQAQDARGNQTDVVPVAFTLDTVPPQFSELNPQSGFVSKSNFTISGRVSELTSEVRVAFGGDEFAKVQVDSSGHFRFDTNFPLDGSADEIHVFQLGPVDAAGNVADPAELIVGLISSPLTALAASPTEMANAHLPEVLVPLPLADDFDIDDRVGGTGIPTSRTRIMLQFADTATVAEANAVLQSLDAVIAETISEINLLLISIPDTGDFTGLEDALELLQANPHVAIATTDVLLRPDSIPTPTSAQDINLGDHSSDNPRGKDPNTWNWNTPPSIGQNADGNWGLEATRMPQAWNLNDFATRQGSFVRTAVFDLGFNDTNDDGINEHPDLRSLQTWRTRFPMLPNLSFRLGAEVNDHGQHVAGIIGASHVNGLGVAGANPLVNSSSVGHGQFIGVSMRPNVVMWETLDDFRRMLSEFSDLNVVNISIGYDWGSDPTTNKWVQGVAQSQGLIVREIMAAHIAVNPKTLVVVSAGNMSDDFPIANEVDSQWDSPWAWAALGPEIGNLPQSGNIVVVGSTDAIVEAGAANPYSSKYTKSDFSNVGPHITAPGGRVLSTVGSNLVNFGDYETFDGTSQAAPLVAGLVGYLLNLQPNLTNDQLLDLMRQEQFTSATVFRAGEGSIPSSVANPGPRPMIDGFAAALGIDLAMGNKEIQRSLVNVDDGTADGNLLRDPFSDEDVTGFAEGDGRRGDFDPKALDPEERQRITMRDFRAWRDAYLAVHAAELAAVNIHVSIPGENTHFKRDLNGDGCVGTMVATHAPNPIAGISCDDAPSENVFPRFDFNGDGEIGHWTTVAPFKIDPDTEVHDSVNHVAVPHAFDPTARPGLLRDIDVLADPDIWSTHEADGYSENVAIDPQMDGQAVGDDGAWQSWAYLLQQHDPPEASEFLKVLPDYIHSFDVHIDVNWQSINPDYEEVLVQIESEKVGPDFADVFEREVRISRDTKLPIVATMPLWTGNVQVSYEGIDQDLPKPSPSDKGALSGKVERLSDVRLGEDRKIEVQGSTQAILHTIINPDPQGRGFPPAFFPSDIAVDSSGRTHFAYRHTVGGSFDVADLYVAYSDDGGETVVRQSLVSGNGQSSPEPWFQRMTVGANDEVYLTYATFLNSVSADIWFTYSLDQGDNFSDPQLISSPDATGIFDASPDVTVDAEGAVHVVWTQGEQLLMRTSTDQGQTFGSAQLLVLDSGGPFQAQIEAGDARQQGEATDLHLTWVAPDGGFPALYYSRRQADGSWTSKATIASDVGTTFFRSYDLTHSSSGLAGVLYVTPSDLPDLMYQPILGGQLLDSKRVSQSPASYDHFGDPALRIDDTGVIWTAWHHENGPMTVAVSQDGGATFDEILVGGSFAAGGVGLALDASQNALVTWSEGDRIRRDLLFKQIGLPTSQASAPQQTSALLDAETFDLNSSADSLMIGYPQLDTSTEVSTFHRDDAFAWEHANRVGIERPRSTWPEQSPATTPANHPLWLPAPVERREAENRLVDRVLADMGVDLLDRSTAPAFQSRRDCESL